MENMNYFEDEVKQDENISCNIDEYSDKDASSMESDSMHMHEVLSQNRLSEFIDSECGEPFESQSIKIDFKPLPGHDDNEFVLMKCMGFWNLVDGNLSIQHLKVSPEEVNIKDTLGSHSGSNPVTSQNKYSPPNFDGVEILEREERNINNIFMTKMKTKYCDGGSGDYFDEDYRSQAGRSDSFTVNCTGKLEHKTNTNWQSEKDAAARSVLKIARLKLANKKRCELTKMCKDMEEWDMHQPRSMEPPAHPPQLAHARMKKVE